MATEGEIDMIVKSWPQLIDVLKDVSAYLEKQDAIQETAKVDQPPKMKETAKPIKGGEAPGFKPGTGVAKEFVSSGDNPKENPQTEISSEGDTLLKEKDKEESEKDKESSNGELVEVSDEDEDDDSDEEVKSLLKDIKEALSKSITLDDVRKEIAKSVPLNMDKMLRKMGFTPTRPDVIKMGIDQTADIKKSEDIVKSDSEDKKVEELTKGVESLSKKSFSELGAMREKLGHFNAFSR